MKHEIRAQVILIGEFYGLLFDPVGDLQNTFVVRYVALEPEHVWRCAGNISVPSALPMARK
jgi:hypothetical protein